MSYMLPDENPLDALPGLPTSLVNKLKESGITTAEQVVATAAAMGTANMGEQLGMEAAELQRLLETAEAALPASERERLKTPIDTSEYGLGVPRENPPD